MVQLINNKNVIVLMFIFGFIQGVFNTMGTVVGEIGAEYGFGPVNCTFQFNIFIE